MSTHDWRVNPEEYSGGATNGTGIVSGGGIGGIRISGGRPYVDATRVSATPDIMLTMSASELLVVVRSTREHMQSVLGTMASASLVNNAMVMNQLRDVATCAERCIELLDHIARNGAQKEPA